MALPRPPQAATAAEEKALAAEENVAWVRFAVITFNIVVYWAWLYPRGIPELAAAVSVVAGLYGIYVVWQQPYRHFPVMQTTLWTAVTDGALIVLWVHASGGFESPFYLLWYLSLFAVAFRYDAKATMITTIVYAALYVAIVAVDGWAGHSIDVLVRVGYILLVGALGSLLARESVGIFRERYHLEQQVRETQRFRMLADVSPDGVAIHRDGVIVEVNQAALDLIGATREQVIGQSGLQWLEPESLETGKAAISEVEPRPHEIWIKTPRGKRLLAVETRALEFQGQPARAAIVRDITDDRLREEERQRASDERQQAAAREMELERLRQMNQFKTNFINTAAHELNTPLTPLHLQIHLLRRQLAPDARESHAAVDILDRNLKRLTSLVQDMLDVARLQSGRLHLEAHPTNLHRLLEEAVETFGEAARTRGLELRGSCDGDPVVNVDSKRFTQVIDNLLSNAIKFTAKGRVHLRCTASPQEVRIDVSDTGVGLSREQADRLFQPFTQVHRGELGHAGTGLGLYISRGIVERHGGTLTVHSDGPGKGATFTVRLPLNASGGPHSIATPP